MDMNKEGGYRKALKNYTTGRGVDSVSKIQKILIGFGATGIGYSYDDKGRITAIHFKMVLAEGDRLVDVPLNTEKVAEVLRQQGYFKDDEHAYRVALANVRDWLDAQLAMLATEMVEFPQIFLPYMVNNSGRTLYEVLKESKFLLPEKTNE